MLYGVEVAELHELDHIICCLKIILSLAGMGEGLKGTRLFLVEMGIL
jgi:hypothetical protein